MARAHLPPRARGTLPRWPMVRPTFTPHEVREKWGVGAGGAPSVLGGAVTCRRGRAVAPVSSGAGRGWL